MNDHANSDSPEQLADRIYRHVHSANYQPVKPRVITKQLGLEDEDRPAVRRALKRLAKQGLVEYGDKHVVRPGKSQTAEKRRRKKDSPARGRASAEPAEPSSGNSSAAEPPEFLFDAEEVVDGEQNEDRRDAEFDDEEAEPDDFGDLPELDDHRDHTGSSDRAGRRARREPHARAAERGASSTTSSHTVVGTFRRTALGHGYVRPLDTPREEGRAADIYVTAQQSLDAASGDTVRVRVDRQKTRGRGPRRARIRGVIVEVVERKNYRFVGSFLERGGVSYVQIDGRVFQQPIPVGDAGVKNVREGDQVVVEIVRFPTHFDEGDAVIAEILGARGEPGVDTLAIIREYDLPGEFPEAAIDDARHQAELFDETVSADRRDLTELTTITIDPVDARDFDDAISLEQLDNGHWLLGVHIADVSHFVPRDSALDREARRRATSVYLPDRVIPMLPEIISNNLASLQPNRVRYTRTVFMEFTPEGICVSREVVRSAIRSKRRFTYEEVDEFLEHPAAWRARLTPEIYQLLLNMRQLAATLRRRRLEGGAIELALPEIKILLDDQGRVAGAKVVENTVSHQIIEDFMLAANRSVAELLNDRELHFLRRIHEPPAPIKLRSLTEFVRELGIASTSMESRFEIKRVIEAVRHEPTEYAVNYAVLRSMQKAVYGPKEAGHYALNWDHYCHFTSPIRRYPDLDVHRMFDALDQGLRPRASRGELRALGDHCSDREQRAEAAERELVKLKLLLYLKDQLGREMHAIITGVEEFGLFAQGQELPAEGFVAISSLQDDYYRFDAATHSLVGHRLGNTFRLGDRIVVEVAHVDLARRELDFRLVKHETAHDAPPRTSKRAKTIASRPAPRKKQVRRRRKSRE